MNNNKEYKVKVKFFGYAFMSDKMIVSDIFRTKEDAIKYNIERYYGYYSNCKVEKIEASNIYMFNGFKKV